LSSVGKAPAGGSPASVRAPSALLYAREVRVWVASQTELPSRPSFPIAFLIPPCYPSTWSLLGCELETQPGSVPACQGCAPSPRAPHRALGSLGPRAAFLRSMRTLGVKSATNSVILTFVFVSSRAAGARESCRTGRMVEKALPLEQPKDSTVTGPATGVQKPSCL